MGLGIWFLGIGIGILATVLLDGIFEVWAAKMRGT